LARVAGFSRSITTQLTADVLGVLRLQRAIRLVPPPLS
jgi:hypothetical protein